MKGRHLFFSTCLRHHDKQFSKDQWSRSVSNMGWRYCKGETTVSVRDRPVSFRGREGEVLGVLCVRGVMC